MMVMALRARHRQMASLLCPVRANSTGPVSTFLRSEWSLIKEKIESKERRTWSFWFVCAPTAVGLSFLVYSNKLKAERLGKRMKQLEVLEEERMKRLEVEERMKQLEVLKESLPAQE